MMLRRPGDSDRHAIVGRTGSGKTIFGLWQLSGRSFDRMPWIIVDFKRDEHIARIPRLTEIDVTGSIPKRRGLYVVRPTPTDIDAGVVTEFLFRVWDRERTGLFIDEGYMLPPRDRGLRTVLTQGRSKRIPMISLSQRPAFISPWLLSESEFITAFSLKHPADIERMQDWMPPCDPSTLEPHHCYWYTLHGDEFASFGPCPGPDEVMELFDARRVRRWFL
jgi:DNA helicase HerA-like ATPase